MPEIDLNRLLAADCCGMMDEELRADLTVERAARRRVASEHLRWPCKCINDEPWLITCPKARFADDKEHSPVAIYRDDREEPIECACGIICATFSLGDENEIDDYDVRMREDFGQIPRGRRWRAA